MFKKSIKIIYLIFLITSIPHLLFYKNNFSDIEKNENPIIFNRFETSNQVALIELANFDDDGGYSEAIAIKDGFVYVANQDQGLEIINITEPTKPKKIANIKTLGNALEVLIKDNYAYVSQSTQGVAIINIQNPKNPYLVNNLKPGGLVKEVDIRENLLHIITAYSGFYLYDISDPSNPIYVSHFDNSKLHTGISVLNKYICLATWGFGLEIIDLTFVSSPMLIGYWNESLSLALGVYSTQIGNQKIAFLASSDDGLEIIDFTNPLNPEKIGSFKGTGGTYYDVVVKDSIAYCSTFGNGLVLVDVSDLTEPIEISTYNTESYTMDCAVENNICGIADGYGGIKIIDVQVPNNIILLSQFFDHGIAFKIEIQNEIAIVADRIGGAEFFDISDPLNPLKISQYRRNELNALDIVIDDDLAIISSYETGLEFVNISDLLNPKKITTYENGNYMKTCAIKDDLVFIGSLNKTIDVLNISQLPNVNLIGQYTFSMDFPNVEELIVKNDILILGYSVGCMLLNISDPSNIVEINSYINYYPFNDIEMIDNLLFCANGPNGLEILDITNNDFKRISGLDTFGSARDIMIEDNTIYLSLQSYGIDVINISDINNPTDIGGYTKKRSYGIAKSGQYLFSSSWHEGLLVLALDSDSDTITDIDEITIWGTNPFKADTDSDGMPDNFEIFYSLNPLDYSDASEDPDEDGLTNVEEYMQIFYYGESTNPFDPDSDSDLMPDGWEVYYGLDPTLPNGNIDSDFDYLTNYQEYLIGTNPKDRDTDGDDAEDGLEVLYNTDPLNPNDNPNKRRLIRVFLSLPLGIVFLIIGVVFLLRNINKRIVRNIEREKRLEEAEDEILLF